MTTTFSLRTVTFAQGDASAKAVAYHRNGVDMIEVTEANDAAREEYGLHVGRQMKANYLWVAERLA